MRFGEVCQPCATLEVFAQLNGIVHAERTIAARPGGLGGPRSHVKPLADGALALPEREEQRDVGLELAQPGPSKDADLLFLTKDLDIDWVFMMGKVAMRKGEVVMKGAFEE